MPDSRPPIRLDPQQYELWIKRCMGQMGWKVELPVNSNQRGYDLIAVKDAKRVAVQVKNYTARMRVNTMEQCLEFTEGQSFTGFTHYYIVCQAGFTDQSVTLWKSHANFDRIRLASEHEGAFIWLNGGAAENEKPLPKPNYIGVVTCKGGVGKTTVAAHLAGAMALSGYNVALIDCDPESNLSLLVGEGITVKTSNREQGKTLTVFKPQEWSVEHPPMPEIKQVVCDCSPKFEANPAPLIAQWSHCIIPTTLNPLGLNTHVGRDGGVVQRTLQAIRALNRTCGIHVLINLYKNHEDTRVPKLIYENYLKAFAAHMEKDDRFFIIDPHLCAIRDSKLLFYWGHHLFTGEKPGLAFQNVGGVCHPRTDFLNLLQYLQEEGAVKKPASK